jgi:carbon-monoxide dehydrogenase medium subunit
LYPKTFDYERATSVEHAIELLVEHGEDARLLAGGASLIPLMKLRLANPSHVIDIGRLPSLTGVRRENGAFVVGALMRHVDLERHPELVAALAIVDDAASHIGDTQVRHMGTIGGGIAECDPAGDWPPVLLALDGAVRARGPRGERTIPAAELFVDAYTTALAPDEVLTEIVLPVHSGAAHVKLERRAGDFAIANCSVALSMDVERCASVRIALGGVGACPLRVPAAEALLSGQVPTEELLDQAAQAVTNATESFDDARGSAEYRRHVGGVVFRRAFDRARQRAN